MTWLKSKHTLCTVSRTRQKLRPEYWMHGLTQTFGRWAISWLLPHGSRLLGERRGEDPGSLRVLRPILGRPSTLRSPGKSGGQGICSMITRKKWRFMNHQKKLAVMESTPRSPEKTGGQGICSMITRKKWRFMNHQKKLEVMESTPRSPEKTGGHGIHSPITRKNWRS